MACECPTKLYYTKKKKYKDNSIDDPFLEGLRDGGFQVGRLAQLYYQAKGPSVLIDTLKEDEALQKTAEALKQDRITIFEAAFCHNDLFIRTDILVKEGNLLRLIEVKSKSYDPDDEDNSPFKKNGLPNSKWEPTFQDIAFQTFVLRACQPRMTVKPYLMLMDKRKPAPVEGMNGYFLLKKVGDKKMPEVVIKESLPGEALEEDQWITVRLDAEAAVTALHGHDYGGKSFLGRIEEWAQAYAEDRKIDPVLSSACAKCQFKATAEERKAGDLSGFHECWRGKTGLSDGELDGPLVLDVWNYRGKDDWIGSGKYRLASLTETDVPEPKTPSRSAQPGWKQTERQRLQIRCVREGKSEPEVDEKGLAGDLSNWKYPLHFIDFETIRAAIPFHKDSAPYEQAAFQFSHHLVKENGTITHVGQWIELGKGKWPNHVFLRKLKEQLDQDEGTILHFSHHEPTVIRDLCDMLEVKDKALTTWFRNLVGEKKIKGQVCLPGNGRMVDMLPILKGRYYHPGSGGSNSLKKILPAILSPGGKLHKKYSQPVYGSNEMPSLNLKEGKMWVTERVWDPYEFLPRICDVCGDLPLGVERLFGDEGIDQGGAAMMAYAKAQFTECSEEEVKGLEKALLQYCELDTLAMVMLWEEWQDHLQNGKSTAAAAPTQKAATQAGKQFNKSSLKKVLKST
jgi:hypothetical protein